MICPYYHIAGDLHCCSVNGICDCNPNAGCCFESDNEKENDEEPITDEI